MDPNVPLLWRMDQDVAGSCVTGDLHSHLVDISNNVAGDIESVAGTSRIFVGERERPEGGRSKIEIEDASIFCASTPTAPSAISRPRASPTAARMVIFRG